MESFFSFLEFCIKNNYLGTALLLCVCGGLWKLYKGEQDRGRDFSIKFAGEIRTLINDNNKAQQEIIAMLKDYTIKQDLENQHNNDERIRLESEFKELKIEMHHLENDITELKHKVDK